MGFKTLITSRNSCKYILEQVKACKALRHCIGNTILTDVQSSRGHQEIGLVRKIIIIIFLTKTPLFSEHLLSSCKLGTTLGVGEKSE